MTGFPFSGDPEWDPPEPGENYSQEEGVGYRFGWVDGKRSVWPELQRLRRGEPMTRACDPVGAVEIAARLDVARRTVDSWRQRDLGFPPPRWTVGGRPAWDWTDVEAWHRARGRP